MNFLISASIFCSLVIPALADRAELISQGDQYDAKYQPDKALEFYLPAEKLQPNDAALLVKIARQYVYRMNQIATDAGKIASVRTALAYSERAVKIAPDLCDAHLSVAICLGKISPFVGNKEGIEISKRIKESASKAVKLDARNDYAWHVLGRWHQELANIGGGTRLLAKMIYGEIPAASNQEAVECFKKAMALRPDRLIHVIELGRSYARMDRKAEAVKLINQGLAMPNKDFDDAETKQRGRATLKELGL